MIKQNINIVNYQTLYNILEEIKTYLSFNIFNYFDEKEFLKHLETNEIDIKKSLFLVKKKDKFFYKNLKINKNQIFEVPDLPINLYSLIEKINIQWDGKLNHPDTKNDNIPSSINVTWSDNSFTWGDVVFIQEIADGIGTGSRRARQDRLNKFDDDTKKRLVRLICRVKGEKVYDETKEVGYTHIKLEDAEVVINEVLGKIKVEKTNVV